VKTKIKLAIETATKEVSLTLWFRKSSG